MMLHGRATLSSCFTPGRGSFVKFRRRSAVGRAIRPLDRTHVIACQRQRVAAFGQLDLDVHMAIVAEGAFGGGEIEQPHPVETLVVQRDDPGAFRHAAVVPVADGQRIVQPQHLDVGRPQPRPLDRRDDLRQGGRIAAGEDVLGGERIGRPRPVGAGDGVDQRDAVGLEQRVDGIEELAIVRQADMFEHADRNDAIEVAGAGGGQRAIVDQLEANHIGDAIGRRLRLRIFQLFLGQGDAGYVRPRDLVDVPRHATPAAADIEHALSRLEIELGGDMGELGLLRGIEAHRRIGEIGAGILAVGIEEQLVKPVVEIIMVGDVALRAVAQIDLPQPPRDPRVPPQREPHRVVTVPAQVEGDEIEQATDIAGLDHQPSIHIGFRRAQRRVDRDGARRAVVGDADGDGGMRRVGGAIAADRARGTGDAQLPVLDDAAEQAVEQEHRASSIAPETFALALAAAQRGGGT